MRVPTLLTSCSYGTLLGSEIFNSAIVGITSFRCLPRPQFATLQTHLLPIYFSMQTTLPLVLALTLPAERTAIGRIPAGMTGVLDPSNRLSVLTPLAITFLMGAVNCWYVGPATTKTMKERKHQETRDGKKSYDPPPHSEEMQALNKRFMVLHGASSTLNLIAGVTTLWYGFTLGARLL